MTVWASAVLLLATATGPVPSQPLFTFQGDDVYESSGLVDRGSLVWTTNDSGDDAVLYGVDSRTGRVVRRVAYADDVEDVEALAPGRDGTLWAGDIGDNQERRDDVTVYRVRPGQDGHAPAYPLTYPDRPHNAEALLVQPGTERVLVVTKSVFGGTVYAAPRMLREGRPNRLHRVADVSGLVTDGTFLPGGHRVLLRTYGTASVYTFPAFDLLGTVTLPAQPQGEGISASPGGRVLVSSEGARTDVLQVRLPRSLTAAGDASARSHAATGPSPSTKGPPPAAQPVERPERGTGDWLAIGAVGAVVAVLGWLTLRGSRLRSPRRP